MDSNDNRGYGLWGDAPSANEGSAEVMNEEATAHDANPWDSKEAVRPSIKVREGRIVFRIGEY